MSVQNLLLKGKDEIFLNFCPFPSGIARKQFEKCINGLLDITIFTTIEFIKKHTQEPGRILYEKYLELADGLFKTNDMLNVWLFHPYDDRTRAKRSPAILTLWKK